MVPHVLALDEVDHLLGDVGRVVGDALEVRLIRMRPSARSIVPGSAIMWVRSSRNTCP